jgi:hypothetical protein
MQAFVLHSTIKYRRMALGLLTAGAVLASIGGGGGGLPGRMTGGGSIISSDLRVTHGFTLNCDAAHSPQRLEVNWEGNHFHLLSMTSASCSNDPNISAGQPYAGINTYTGTGTGRFNGVDGATIDFVFVDAGEPGTDDTANYTIRDADFNLVLSASGNLDNGNHQAHK